MAIDWASLGAALGGGLSSGMQQNLQGHLFQRQLAQARQLPQLSQDEMMKLYYLTGKSPMSAAQSNPLLGLQLLTSMQNGTAGINLPGYGQTANMPNPGQSTQLTTAATEQQVNDLPDRSGVGSVVREEMGKNQLPDDWTIVDQKNNLVEYNGKQFKTVSDGNQIYLQSVDNPKYYLDYFGDGTVLDQSGKPVEYDLFGEKVSAK